MPQAVRYGAACGWRCWLTPRTASTPSASHHYMGRDGVWCVVRGVVVVVVVVVIANYSRRIILVREADFGKSMFVNLRR